MNLKDIVLKPTNEQKFGDLFSHWYGWQLKNKDAFYAILQKSLAYPSCVQLLEDFVNTNYADRISYYGEQGWNKFLVRKITMGKSKKFLKRFPNCKRTLAFLK